MMKHKHPEFPSDVFLTLLAADGMLKIGDSLDGTTSEIDLLEFVRTDMSKKLILSISIPKQDDKTFVSKNSSNKNTRNIDPVNIIATVFVH